MHQKLMNYFMPASEAAYYNDIITVNDNKILKPMILTGMNKHRI